MLVLACDDEDLIREELVEDLSQVLPQASIHAFEDGQSLLDYAAANGCDVAFLDIQMTGITGMETAKRLKEMIPHVNIIFVTGFDSYKAEAMDIHASGYVTKPFSIEKLRTELDFLRFPIQEPKAKKLKVRCFGNFDVFLMDGTPFKFPRTKCKELFAYLVYKKGTGCTVKELVGELFEDRLGTESDLTYVRIIISQLRQALEAAGVGEVINRTSSDISVAYDKVDCDYFNYLDGNESILKNYSGDFMSQYSWAEEMAGYLTEKAGHR